MNTFQIQTDVDNRHVYSVLVRLRRTHILDGRSIVEMRNGSNCDWRLTRSRCPIFSCPVGEAWSWDMYKTSKIVTGGNVKTYSVSHVIV